jgi:lipid A 4'-phosphatase
MTRTRRKSAEGDTHDEESLHRLNHLVWAVFFFSTAIFTKFPGLDLLISVRYYDAARGFIHRSHPVVLALYDWTPWIGRALVIALAVYALLAPLLARHFDKQGEHSLALRARGSWRHLATVAVVCGLLGPGLIIEGIFKNQMGRPRPVQVLEFGGAQAYQGPFVPGITPERNRSFVSSHAADRLLADEPGPDLRPAVAPSLAVDRHRWPVASIGLGRMLQGGHFFSDILFAFFTVWLSCEIVAWLDKRRRSRHT